MSWLKRLFGGEQKAAPDTREKQEAAFASRSMPSSSPLLSPKWATMPSPVQGDPLTLNLAPGVILPLVRVPAGEFIMGSGLEEPGAYVQDDEKPQHKVYLDEYLIGTYEVTVSQFRVFVKATGYGVHNKTLPVGKDRHPVVYVSWNDAMAFCRWASEVTGQDVHLPTEAQWEKAARGIDGRIYPWGNEKPDSTNCNCCSNVGASTPVDQYSPLGDSPYGCADMVGNVSELVKDWYRGDYYSFSPASNPLGPTSGESKVSRGGGWDYDWQGVRAAFRFYYSGDRDNCVSFRCAVSPRKVNS